MAWDSFPPSSSVLIQLGALAQAWYAFEASRMMVKLTANRACQGSLQMGLLDNMLPGYAGISWSIVIHVSTENIFYCIAHVQTDPYASVKRSINRAVHESIEGATVDNQHVSTYRIVH